MGAVPPVSSPLLGFSVSVLDAFFLPPHASQAVRTDGSSVTDRLLMAHWEPQTSRDKHQRGAGDCVAGGWADLFWDRGTTSRDIVKEVFQRMWLVIMERVECQSTICLCKWRDDGLRELETQWRLGGGQIHIRVLKMSASSVVYIFLTRIISWLQIKVLSWYATLLEATCKLFPHHWDFPFLLCSGILLDCLVIICCVYHHHLLFSWPSH